MHSGGIAKTLEFIFGEPAEFTGDFTYDSVNITSGQTKPPFEEFMKIYDKLAPLYELRIERNQKLAETDWTQTNDIRLENEEEWVAYRQALRDLPSLETPIWPEPPQVKIRTELSDTKTELKADLSETKVDLQTTRTELTETKADLQTTQSELTETKADLQTTRTELTETKAELVEERTLHETTRTQLRNTQTELDVAKIKLLNIEARMQIIESNISKVVV